MNLGALAVSAGMSFVFLAAVFRPLEMLFPAKPGQAFLRPQWFTDLCFFLGQYLLWIGAVVWLLAYLSTALHAVVPQSLRDAVAAQPWALQAFEVIVLGDLLVYWGHRLQHRVDFLWRFHAVHHSAEHLDWLAAHREHPLDTVYTMAIVNLPALLLGFPLESIAGVIAFRGIWAIYIHSNVRLPLGPFGLLLGSPALHHWHHDRARDAGNYGNVSPLIDVIFGTHHDPGYEPASFGVKDQPVRSYLGHLLAPLRGRAPSGAGAWKEPSAPQMAPQQAR